MSVFSSLIISHIWFGVALFGVQAIKSTFLDYFEPSLLPFIEQQSIPKIVNHQQNYKENEFGNEFQGEQVKEHMETGIFNGVSEAFNTPQFKKTFSHVPLISMKYPNFHDSIEDDGSTTSKSIHVNMEHLHIHHHYINLKRYTDTLKTHRVQFGESPADSRHQSGTETIKPIISLSQSMNNMLNSSKSFDPIKSVQQSPAIHEDTSDKQIESQIDRDPVVDQPEIVIKVEQGTTTISPNDVKKVHILSITKTSHSEKVTSEVSPPDTEYTAYGVPLN